MYNIVLASDLQQSDSVLFIYMCVCVYIYIYIYIYINFFRFFPLIGYYKILNIVPCAIQ